MPALQLTERDIQCIKSPADQLAAHNARRKKWGFVPGKKIPDFVPLGKSVDFAPPVIVRARAQKISLDAMNEAMKIEINRAEYVRTLELKVKELVNELRIMRIGIIRESHKRVMPTLAVPDKLFESVQGVELLETRILLIDIIGAVSRYFMVTPSELKSRRRHRTLVRCRHLCFWLARSFTFLSYPQIGKQLGGFDHSTVLHGCRKHTELMKKNRRIKHDTSAVMIVLGVELGMSCQQLQD